ncbi:MAG: rod-binding protein [Kiloniellales bacterium]|nr:rod-binding protein [Kiloniellales bacterium]
MQLQSPILDLAAAPVQAANQGLNASGRSGDRSAVRAAAEQFEAVFLSQILTPMFETVDTDPMFGGGPGEQIYRSLLVEEYGKAIANAGGVGIADHVEREMLKLQEVKK